jgi:hypothetical protein
MKLLTLQIRSDERRRTKMFGPMQVTRMFQLSKLETVDEAVAKLLEFAEYPKIYRWFQFPTTLVAFLAHADSPDSEAVYVYDRKQCVWLWLDFNDHDYGGYSPAEFDVLINQCHFLRLAASHLPSPVARPMDGHTRPGAHRPRKTSCLRIAPTQAPSTFQRHSR